MSQYKELADRLDRSTRHDAYMHAVIAKAIAILRSLDAQPVAEVMVMGSYRGKPILGCVLHSDSAKVGDKLYAAPVAAQPTSTPLLVRDLAASLCVQPLAVCEALQEFGFGNFSVNMAVPADAVKVIERKFAQPQQAKPLSDAEILAIVKAAPALDTAEEEWLHVARAIEAAHGIKEHP